LSGVEVRARADLDRLVGVDVRAAIRWIRLPLVASLFLAALLGVAPSAQPAPAPAGTVVAAAQAGISATAVSAPAEPVAADTAAAPVSTLDDDLPAVVIPATSALIDQADHAALAPRAPPHV
jgi:hypothetical protein